MDYGAGDGRFLEAWLDSTDGTAVAYDPAPQMLRIAATRLSRFGDRVQIVDTLKAVNQRFDAVTFHAVWMCLPSRATCLNCLSDVHNLLADKGAFFASVTHPCFRDRQFSTFRTSFDMDDYTREGSPFEVSLFDGEEVIKFTDFHWSLGEMSRQLHETGFTVQEITELPDVDREPWPRAFPWLLFSARKSSL
ncbi:MAG: class I SAM-dependent methyltransferase [Chloroflexi bacterium]|nr:class I SAM-dependent methyltransferase [Chloroflexota bacterium]